MTREIHIGWDGAGRQGANAVGKMPVLTERSDLKGGNAGWEGATKGTGKRVAAKLGKMP